MISFEEAQALIIAACEPTGTEMVAIDQAVERVLARTLYADADLVPFARSAMDGYALRSADAFLGAILPVREHVYAEPSGPVRHDARTATQIATGAPIPRGADAVIPIEEVVRENGSIRLAAPVGVGTHIFPPGEDARAGDRLLAAGRRLRPADIGLLAAGGHVQLMVFRRPVAVVLTTGDEVVDPSQVPSHGQIRNSNAALINATLAAWGCAVAVQEHVRDDEGAVRAAFEQHLGTCDLLITTGGASVGERDLVKTVLAGPFEFDSVALRPAKPTAFALKGRTRVLVLPGNPSSAFVALHEFVRLAAFSMLGEAEVRLPRVVAKLAGAIHGKASRTYAAYAILSTTADGFVATPLVNQCSALTRTASDASGFIVLPPGARDLGAGEQVSFDIVDWSRVAGSPSARDPLSPGLRT